MSGGTACTCEEWKRPAAARAWVVTVRHANHSAFNGYHRTPSDYSALRCVRCGRVWRTKAGYVALLPDGTHNTTLDEVRR